MTNYLFKNYYSKKFSQNQSFCGFDLDYTIIKTKSGRVFLSQAKTGPGCIQKYRKINRIK